MRIRTIAALGSSFASGPGIQPLADRAAGRSTRNYPSLLAERLGARLVDRTVAGATTATILEERQRVGLRRFPPQLEGVPADADLVTVTAGGNDLGYIGSMSRLALASWLRGRPLTRALGRSLAGQGVPTASDAAVEGVADGLVRIVEAAHGRAPRARIVLVDYLTVLGGASRRSREAPFDETERGALRALAGRLESAFALAAERSGADLLKASALSAAHGIGSGEPWVRGFGGSAPFHPTETGMRAVADALAELVTEQPSHA